MNQFKNKILLLGIITTIIVNCNILSPEKKKDNSGLAALALLSGQQNTSRTPGIYISGKVVGADGKTAIANAKITIEGRGENSAIVKGCYTAGALNTCSTVNANRTQGFYKDVLSDGASNGATQPITLYGSTTSGAPAASAVTTDCGSTVATFYATQTRTRTVCDSSTLDTTAKSSGILDTLIPAGTNVGTITAGSDGSFSAVSLSSIATGNTYTVKVEGKTKTRRLRISKSGSAGFLNNYCTSTSLPVADCAANGALENSKIDLVLGTGALPSSTTEGLADVAATSASAYDFNITDLQVEIVYSKPYDILTGTLSANTTLSATRDYLLSGTVIVPSGVTLTIPAGTRIYGAVSPAGALLVKQGGKIDAQGTATNPIVFTSEKSAGSRSAGDWQGIILQGNGIQTFGGYGVTAIGEGDTGSFGGSNDADNSGTMKYVRIEFAGAPFSPGNERNCLSLMGVGSGTTLQYIQCHRGFDDGFEWWGGAVNTKYLVASGNRDDQFDYADGLVGTLQFGIAHIYSASAAANDDSSRCIEGDGNSAQACSSGSKKTGGVCSDPSFANITCIGTAGSTNQGDAIFVRRSSSVSAGTFSHFFIQNFGSSRSSNCSSQSGQASVNHTYISNVGAVGVNNTCTANTVDQASGMSVTNAADATVSPNYSPTGTNTTVGSVNVNTIIPSADSATFYGAILQGGTDWTTGWTAYPTN